MFSTSISAVISTLLRVKSFLNVISFSCFVKLKSLIDQYEINLVSYYVLKGICRRFSSIQSQCILLLFVFPAELYQSVYSFVSVSKTKRFSNIFVASLSSFSIEISNHYIHFVVFGISRDSST